MANPSRSVTPTEAMPEAETVVSLSKVRYNSSFLTDVLLTASEYSGEANGGDATGGDGGQAIGEDDERLGRGAFDLHRHGNFAGRGAE